MTLQKFKGSYLIVIWAIILHSCQVSNEDVLTKISITNPHSFDLKDKPVAINKSWFDNDYSDDMHPVIVLENDTLPAQVDDLDGDGLWDELFFVINLSAGETKVVELVWVENPVEFEKRTNIRFGVRESFDDIVKPQLSHTFYPHQLPGVMGYQPYQTDGPSWENDKVGFRHYLDGRNSKDVFGKRVNYMSPGDVGINEEGVTEDNYHVMEEWGRDILAVGNSVGIGGFGLLINEKLARIGVTEQDSLNNVHETHYSIQANGPVRGLMEYSYEGWEPEEFKRSYQVKETTSIWPGMYAYKNTVVFDNLEGDEMAVIGLVNSNTDKPLSIMETEKNMVLYTHDKQTYNKEWYLGLALILPKDIYRGYLEAPKSGRLSNTYLAKLSIKEKQPISYYAVAAWELSDEDFQDEENFKSYLQHLSQQLEADLIVKKLE